MIIGIYSRKSKLTEKGDSIENQIKICQEYINTHFENVADVRIYEDEGFSGGNTDRPKFQKLLKDIQDKRIQVLVCYRLDRISRNVVDFSSTLELMQSNDIDFVSIKENFDTSSPMGRAMVYISSVFAQLERETIADRIRDNLLELAKSGRYLQAKPPMGFVKEKIPYTDKNGHTKYYNLLKLHPEESAFVKTLFNDYFHHQSITKIETELLQKGVKTRTGSDYRAVTIRRILSHPIYCTADATAYNYFEKLGCNIINPPEDFNGKFGIYIFRRFKQKNKGTTENDTTEWHIGVGSHEPFIDSAVWIKAREVMESRRVHTQRRPIGKTALLSGMLKCGNCGAYMRPYAKVGDRFYYTCNTKEQSKRKHCNIKNIRGDSLDEQIFKGLSDIFSDPGFQKVCSSEIQIKKEKNHIQDLMHQCQNQIAENEKSIRNLIIKLAKAGDTVEEYIESYIKELDNENKELKKKLNTIRLDAKEIEEKELQSSLINQCFRKLTDGESNTTVRRNLLKNIIKEIIYDGETLAIRFVED